MLKLKKKLSFWPTRKRDAGRWTPDRIMARLKSPFPYGSTVQFTGSLDQLSFLVFNPFSAGINF